ncbi:CLUMA_CG000119, isoform A, partial [Clunio marinus]
KGSRDKHFNISRDSSLSSARKKTSEYLFFIFSSFDSYKCRLKYLYSTRGRWVIPQLFVFVQK